jgi:hypothetical protein
LLPINLSVPAHADEDMTLNDTATAHGRATRRFRLSRLLLVLTGLALVLILIGVLSAWRIAYLAKQEYDRRMMTRYSFELSWAALRTYEWQNGRLPSPVHRGSADRPLYSWRGTTALLTENWFPDTPSGSWDAEASWDSPANRQLADFPHRFSYDGLVYWGMVPEEYCRETCQMAITGSGTAFGDDREKPKSLRELDDDTILVVETRNSGIHWMEPGDFDIETMPRTVNAADGRGLSSRYVDGFHVLFADGEVWFVSYRVPFQTMEIFFTVGGANENDREKLLAPYLLYRHSTRPKGNRLRSANTARPQGKSPSLVVQ